MTLNDLGTKNCLKSPLPTIKLHNWTKWLTKLIKPTKKNEPGHKYACLPERKKSEKGEK